MDDIDRLTTELEEQVRGFHQDPSNKLYNRHQTKFKQFVDGFPGPGGRAALDVQSGKYVSEKSLKTFFLAQKDRKCNRSTAMKIVYALNQLSEYEKSPLGSDLMQSTVGSTIKLVLDLIEKKAVERSNDKTKDPHDSNPTNIINQEDISKVMRERLKKSTNWVDLIVVWAVTTVTLMRFDNSQRLTLNKLFVLEDLPPMGTRTPHDSESWGDMSHAVDGRVIGFLIPPPDQIKKNQKHMQKKTEAVGGYRHKRFERCVAGILGFSLLERLDKINISFLDPDHVPDGQVHWSTVKLFDLDYDNAYKNYAQMLKDAGVGRWSKVTHMRYSLQTCFSHHCILILFFIFTLLTF